MNPDTTPTAGPAAGPGAALEAAPVGSAVDVAALAGLASGYRPRPIRPLGSWDLAGHVVKAYSITAPGRTLDPVLTERARAVVGAQLRVDREVGGLGLAVLIVHLGGDGDYVILQSWIEGYMSRLTLFASPANQPHLLRPAPTGLAPCTWELAVLGHERDAYQRLLTAPNSAAALSPWESDTLDVDI